MYAYDGSSGTRGVGAVAADDLGAIKRAGYTGRGSSRKPRTNIRDMRRIRTDDVNQSSGQRRAQMRRVESQRAATVTKPTTPLTKLAEKVIRPVDVVVAAKPATATLALPPEPTLGVAAPRGASTSYSPKREPTRSLPGIPSAPELPPEEAAPATKSRLPLVLAAGGVALLLVLLLRRK